MLCHTEENAGPINLEVCGLAELSTPPLESIFLGERRAANENLPGAQKQAFRDDVCEWSKTKKWARKGLERAFAGLLTTPLESIFLGEQLLSKGVFF